VPNAERGSLELSPFQWSSPLEFVERHLDLDGDGAMVSDFGEVTQLFHSARKGDKGAQDRIIRLLYPELKRIARQRMRGERREHTLDATALVNEAYLRLAAQQDLDWASRTHFFAIAANLMRRVLTDHARARLRHKRGGGEVRTVLNENIAGADLKVIDVIALDECLTRLAKIDPRQVQIVEMLFFAGLNADEIAQHLGVSTKTVRRDWQVARAWLYRELRRSNGTSQLGDS
jgi:RNA polymerase sigma-70 factor (ECF subfamily)